jgi:hypothetical protein
VIMPITLVSPMQRIVNVSISYWIIMYIIQLLFQHSYLLLYDLNRIYNNLDRCSCPFIHFLLREAKLPYWVPIQKLGTR